MKKKVKKKVCYRNVGDCIEGDSIRVESRIQTQWKLFRMTNTHQGKRCVIKKNAKATIIRSFTNIQK